MVETERAEQGVVTGAEIVGAGELHVDDLDLVAPRFVLADGAACEGGKLFHLLRRSRLVGRIARRVGDHLAVDQDRRRYQDRKRVGAGKSGSSSVNFGGRRINKKK